MKAFIAFVVLLFVALGAGGGFLYLKKMNRIEKWGIGLPLDNPIEANERELVEARYNDILDREDILKLAIEKHKLTSYYEKSSVDEVVPLLREDSFIELPDNGQLHILMNGKRKERKIRAATTKTLAEEFIKIARQMGG